ncbi:hypothetical protein SDC9_179677 [bioreactor metagenome]|uniref:YetF C-terminal domain-containing protein n=1 Tax=bioreactor metagenome TaxID=1076179 RepID=A0A645GZG2_9ZZZZ
MDINFIWQTVITFIFGVLALRLAGRKSLSQMTAAETIVMIAVGTILIEPLVGKELWKTFAAVIIVIATLYLLESAQIRWRFLERLFSGTSIVVIEHGQIKLDNLKKIRLTVHQLEMHLRQSSVAKIEEVEYATIEPNGQLGYTLKEAAQSVTKSDIEMIMKMLQTIEKQLGTAGRLRPYENSADNLAANDNKKQAAAQDTLFREVEESSTKKL